jgi:hypothetical protein
MNQAGCQANALEIHFALSLQVEAKGLELHLLG